MDQGSGRVSRRELEKQKQEMKRLRYRNVAYVLFLTVAFAVTSVMLIGYIRLESSITQSVKQVAALQSQLNNLKTENDEMKNRIDSSINLEEIRRIAITELGMTYAGQGQIVEIPDDGSDYVRQYAGHQEVRQVPDWIRKISLQYECRESWWYCFCLVLLAFAGLSVRLILINRDNGDSYKKQVLSQQQYSSTTIPYKRGEILDNKGTKLASSEKVYDLVLDIKQMNNKEDYVEPTIQALEDYFGIDGDQVRAYAQEHPDSQYYVLKKRMSYNEISDYQQMMADTSQKEYNQYVKGIWFEESYKRVYPNSSLASDVIGFTRTDGTGTYGLEEYYNDVLSGVNGRQYGYIDGDDNLQRTTEAAVDGYNVYSTIDATIQGIVEKYLKKYNDENKDSTREGNGAQDAACIVMDVHSGEVLAMASYPTFDLNDTRNPEALIGSKLIDVSGNSTDTVINEEIAACDEAGGK